MINVVEEGLLIWICEGSKEGNERMVELVNSDVGIIIKFLQWLRRKGIDEKRLRARIQAHPSQLEEATNTWSLITDIPKTQFNKPILKKGELRKGRHSVVIRYSSKKLFDEIKHEAQENGFLVYP